MLMTVTNMERIEWLYQTESMSVIPVVALNRRFPDHEDWGTLVASQVIGLKGTRWVSPQDEPEQVVHGNSVIVEAPVRPALRHVRVSGWVIVTDLVSDAASV